MTEVAERYLPLYEGRMGHQFNHRFASLSGEGAPDVHDENSFSMPQYWVASDDTQDRLARRTWASKAGLLGHRRVARSTDDRTQIAAVIPWGAASYGWIISSGPDARGMAMLLGAFNSFAYDYCLRNSLSQPSIPQSTSEQIPVPTPEQCDQFIGRIRGDADWIVARVGELTYTASDVADFGAELGLSWPPFVWESERRFMLRAELDATFFHLYGVARDDVDYIMDTFPIVRRKDDAEHGEFRTKRVILEVFDAMQAAMDAGVKYQTILDPPPGQGPRHPVSDQVQDGVRRG